MTQRIKLLTTESDNQEIDPQDPHCGKGELIPSSGPPLHMHAQLN